MNITPDDYRLSVITGRRAVGKSAYALQNTVLLAQQGIYTIYFSYEMPVTAIFTRLLSHLGKLNKQDIEHRKIEPQKVRQVIQDNASIFQHIAISDSGTEKAIRQDIETFTKNPDITNLTLFTVFDCLQRIPMFQFDDPMIRVEKSLNLISKIAADYQCSAYMISTGKCHKGDLDIKLDAEIWLRLVKFDDKNTIWRSINREEYAREQAQDRSYVKVSVVKNRHGAGSQKVFLFNRPTQTFHRVTLMPTTIEE